MIAHVRQRAEVEQNHHLRERGGEVGEIPGQVMIMDIMLLNEAWYKKAW